LPKEKNEWEYEQVCNPGVTIYNGKVYIFCRAEGKDRMKSSSWWFVSCLELTISNDGFNIEYRSSEPIFKPEAEN